MSWPLFQSACLVVLAFAYAWSIAHAPDRRRAIIEIALVFVAAWAAEETAIVRYRFYAYPDAWWGKLDEMPLLVAAIWPMVVLSSRALVDVFFPRASTAVRALAVGVAVVIDATLVESIAVAAGLWGWVEGGYLGVPLIGLFGWGAFAASMTFALDRISRRSGPRPLVALATVLGALAGTHALLVAGWWLFFRHALRAELPSWTVGLVAAALVALGLHLRRRGRLPIALVVPRVAATSVFVVLLVVNARLGLVVHFAAVAVMYLTLLRWPAFGALRDR